MSDVNIINLPNHVSGDTFAGYRFDAKTEAGVNYPLTGSALQCSFRFNNPLGTITQTFTIGSGLSWIDEANGIFQINTQVISWAAGKYYYEIEITLADTTILSPIKGTFTIKPQTTI